MIKKQEVHGHTPGGKGKISHMSEAVDCQRVATYDTTETTNMVKHSRKSLTSNIYSYRDEGSFENRKLH